MEGGEGSVFWRGYPRGGRECHLEGRRVSSGCGECPLDVAKECPLEGGSVLWKEEKGVSFGGGVPRGGRECHLEGRGSIISAL